MTAEPAEIEFYIFIDQDGDFVLDTDFNSLGAKYVEEVSDSVPNATRVLHLKLTVPLPGPIAVSATIPDTDGPVTVTVS